METPQKIVLIGAGNVGTHLGKRLHEKGLNILQVFSRRKKKAKLLAGQIDAKACSDLSKISSKADLYILAVHDDGIRGVAEQLAHLNSKKRLFVHTSGATPTTVFEGIFKNYGSFYPLQTFSIHRPANFDAIPICIDTKKKKSLPMLDALARLISPKVYCINDEQRAVLHVAAVFVNNFTNYLFHIGEKICDNGRVPFDILRPLIQETAAKIQENSAQSMQTGPAIRGDQATIERHLYYLQALPHYQVIYDLLTDSIQEELQG